MLAVSNQRSAAFVSCLTPIILSAERNKATASSNMANNHRSVILFLYHY